MYYAMQNTLENMNLSTKTILLGAALAFFFVACDSKPQEETQAIEETPAQEATVIRGPKATLDASLHSLYDSLMYLHDHEAMPAHGPTVTLRRKIKALYDSAQVISEADQALLQKLETAGDGMMEWMRAFETDYSGWSLDSAESYLTHELDRMHQINEAMQAAVQEAKARLESSEE